MGALRYNFDLIFANLLFGANFSFYVSLTRNYLDFQQIFIIRKSKCSTDFKRNDFLKKNEAYPLGALRSLKFAYRKLRISLFVELAV